MSLLLPSTEASERKQDPLSCRKLAKCTSIPDATTLPLVEKLLRNPCSYELCYDPEFKIGQPLPAGLLDQSSLDYSPYVLYISFVGPQEDQTQSIDAVMADMYARHSIIHRPTSTGLVFLSRDETSIHVRTACKTASTCEKAGCKRCRTVAQAVRTLVHDLCIMVNSVSFRQIQYAREKKTPFPSTSESAFRELLTQLLCEFRYAEPGEHHVSCRSGKFQSRSGTPRSIVASTWQSGPYPGCVYGIAEHTIMPRSAMPTAQCNACLEPFTSVALLQLPCACLLCEGCLVRRFQIALSSRQSFPAKCCRRELAINQYVEYLPADIVRSFVAAAAEYKATLVRYCADSTCSTFISATLCDADNCLCPNCYQTTCIRCTKLVSEHTYEPKRVCPRNPDEQQVLELAEAQNWATCPTCGIIVERSDGCNHMLCHCGQQFCYICNTGYTGRPTCLCGMGPGYLDPADIEASDEGESERDSEEEEADVAGQSSDDETDPANMDEEASDDQEPDDLVYLIDRGGRLLHAVINDWRIPEVEGEVIETRTSCEHLQTVPVNLTPQGPAAGVQCTLCEHFIFDARHCMDCRFTLCIDCFRRGATSPSEVPEPILEDEEMADEVEPVTFTARYQLRPRY